MRNLLIAAIDPSLGRFDMASLTDQQCMELFIAECSAYHQKDHQDSEGLYLSVCDWDSVECDAENHVIEIYDPYFDGKLDLQYLPNTIK